MIVAERKPMSDIIKMLDDCAKISVVGCGTCVTVCSAGGEKEVSLVASLLRMSPQREHIDGEIVDLLVERQCEFEMLEEVSSQVQDSDAVLSMGCGAGVQTMAAHFEGTPIFPGLNTKFIGIPEQQGVWTEQCLACGDCMLDLTGGICPMARCAKNILNGPCGGSQDGFCEVEEDTECGWQLIYDRLHSLGRLQILENIEPPRDWSSSEHGGPRKIRREDLIL